MTTSVFEVIPTAGPSMNRAEGESRERAEWRRLVMVKRRDAITLLDREGQAPERLREAGLAPLSPSSPHDHG